ncbi:MAG TPA: acetyl-CoA hydrolase/transferase C-terminal domain-containing protein [Acidimicrobiales bacterium]|nr:acetyl-CoA hydrolase/transferase C-terminal domain-containing protein [Acidimicrobiales bacterium]
MTLAVYADGPDGPLPDPRSLHSVGPTGDLAVLLGWVVRPPGWLESSESPEAEISTLLIGAGLRKAVGAGRVRYVPARLSAVPGLLAGRLKPDVAVVGAMEEDGWWRLVGSPGWAAVAAASARQGVVIERWPSDAAPARGEMLPRVAVLSVLERTEPGDALPENRLGPEEQTIGRLVAGLVPAGATVQWGPGAIGAAVVDSLDRPVRVRSGLVTDELVALAGRGLLEGPAEAAYLWGGPDLHSMVGSGDLVLRPVSHTHDLTMISATRAFVAINTALQVGLDGAVNVESVGGRVVTGPGGHPDFAAGASRSPGGLSVVALKSTAGGRSTIVAAPEVVSTPRCDIDVVVTEHGAADLRGASPEERAERLVEIAAPEFREHLRAPA